MRQTTTRRFTPPADALVRITKAQRVAKAASEKAASADRIFSHALLDGAESGYTMRELARHCGLALSNVYRRITDAEKAS